MNQKVVKHISEMYITLMVLFPYFIFCLNGIYPGLVNSRIIPVFLAIFYAPSILWGLIIRSNESTAKYYIGFIKLTYSFNVLPLITLVFINFTEVNFVNTINVYIILMTALFFALDGHTDLIDAFKNTIYYNNFKIQKLTFNIFVRLIRRYIIFLGLSMVIAICYLIFIANFYSYFINSPDYVFGILNGISGILGCFFLGWTFLVFNASKRIRSILMEEIREGSNISTWINLLQLPKYIRFFITAGPFILFIVQMIVAMIITGIMEYSFILTNLLIGILCYVIILYFQYFLFRKIKFF